MDRLNEKQRNKLFVSIIIPIVLYIGCLLMEHVKVSDIPWMISWLQESNDSVMDTYPVFWFAPLFAAGMDVYIEACINIKHGNFLDEKFLMMIATLGAFYCREYSEAVAVMIFYQIGEFFQSYAVGKSRNAISELMSIAPDFANREIADGKYESIDPDDIEVGDILAVFAGEKIPVDAIVIEGEGYLNTSALTGESMPLTVKAGDEVISGCINGDTLLKIQAVKTYENSTVSQILELVENAANKKSKTERFITRFAKYYTPIVVGCAVVLAVVPSIIFGNWVEWILRACTFLVISCPCALVISVPLAFFGGIGAASKIGALIKGANYLEMMANLDVLVSDKTGTLTSGEFKVTTVDAVEGNTCDDVLKFAAAIEKVSTHPIAKAIVSACDNPVMESMISDVVNVPGKGMIGDVGFSKIIAGNAALLSENGVIIPEDVVATKNTIVYVAKNGKYIGSIEVADEPKLDAKSALENIRKEGVSKVVMLTGDSEEAAAKAAGELGITNFRAELLPQDKVKYVEGLLAMIQGEKKFLAYIGDGINDAPVLARSDIGIAMGSLGSDAAIEAADIVIMDDKLDKIASLIGIARKTIGISKTNIIFALAVKIICLILGALGIANMWVAVFADVGVAIICILNSMRMLLNNKETKNVEG